MLQNRRGRGGSVLGGSLLLIGGLLLTAGIAFAQGPGGAPGGPPGAGGPGGPGGPGGFSMPPDMQAKMQAYMKWGQDHKNALQLTRTLGSIGVLNREPENKLDKKQSAKVLAVIGQWKGKPELKEDQASTVEKQLTAILTEKQLKRLKSPEFAQGGMGFPGGGGFGGGAGRGGPGGAPRPGGPGGQGVPPGKGPGGAGSPGNAPGGPGAPPRPGAGGPGAPGGAGGPGGPGGAGGFKIPDPPKGGFNPLNPDSFPMEQVRPALKKSLTDFTTTLQKQAK